jgi:serine/threonine protein kinase
MPDSSTASNQLPAFVGKYKIVRMIARSNDVVYEAIDPHLGRRVALKELTLAPDISGAAKRERIERFQREAKAAGALKHPNIVTIYEVSQHLEHRFIAMEYLEGQTLRQALQVGGPMSIHDAVRISLQLCDALGYAHTQGVVHRDVKPDNIHLIAPNNTVKLTDFGIARVLSEPSITSIGQVFGTPAYMSPEQLTSRQVDHRSDIFSAGSVVFEMLTGKKLFQGDNVVAITYKIMQTEPEIPASIPPGIATILHRALVKDPDQRYQNMRSMAADLRHELAFYDSPHHMPLNQPSGGGLRQAEDPDRTVVMQQDGAPTTLVMQGAGNTTDVSQQSDATSARNEQPPTTYHPSGTAATASILTAIDSDSTAKSAAVHIVLYTIAIASLIICAVVTFWNCVDRFGASSHHKTALEAYNKAREEASASNFTAAITDYSNAQNIASSYNDSIADLAQKGEADCYVALGAAAQVSGDGLNAQQQLGQALALNFNSPVAHYNMGVVHRANGDIMDALREFSLAHQIDPTGVAGLVAKGQAQDGYLELGDQDYQGGDNVRARQNYQKVIDLDPGDDAASKAKDKLAQLPQQ